MDTVHVQRNSQLIVPYGGNLISRIVEDEAERSRVLQKMVAAPVVRLSFRSLCDLELLATGAFSPLSTFMNKGDYVSVRDHLRLTNGTCYPMPITLPIDDPHAVKEGQDVVLAGPSNECVALMHVEEIFSWDREKEAKAVYGTTKTDHPLVAEMYQWGNYCISGPIRVLRLSEHLDFPQLYGTPVEVRARLDRLGSANVIAFQTRNPLHKGHEAIMREALRRVKGTLLLHPAVGMTSAGDVDMVTRVRTYEWFYTHILDRRRSLLALIPLAMRMAGPREALWHAIIRRNYGANHMIIGRDHASPGPDTSGKSFYPPFAAQKLAMEWADQVGITIIPFDEMVYVPSHRRYESRSTQMRARQFYTISGTDVRHQSISRFPSWLVRPSIARILDRASLPRGPGFCVWFTGLPCSGKSTIAKLLAFRIRYAGSPVTLLDGDVMRGHLSKDLGFSKQDRDEQVFRLGFIASEIVKHQGIVICSAVSPYEQTRNRVRSLIGPDRFILIHITTPLKICEQRDVTFLYRKARRGYISHVTGIDDPYEVPNNPVLRLSTAKISPERNTNTILAYLAKKRLFSEHS